MSASVKHCGKLIDRLDSLPLPFGVERPALKTELVRTLTKCSRSDDHASQIVQHALDNLTVCPTPTEIQGIARIDEAEAPWAPEPDTEPEGKCGCDHGFLHFEIERDTGAGRQRYSCCKPCSRCNPNWGGKAA